VPKLGHAPRIICRDPIAINPIVGDSRAGIGCDSAARDHCPGVAEFRRALRPAARCAGCVLQMSLCISDNVALSDAAFAVYKILLEIISGTWVDAAVPSTRRLSGRRDSLYARVKARANDLLQ